MPPKEKYTDPELREQVKEELKEGDKGGAPGQWSARKAQMMASEYRKRGGDYNTDKSKQDESQKNLSKWGEEEWQTKEGSGNAKQEDGTQKRYLPKKAWENMTAGEKEETDAKKQEGSKEGKQFVDNTDTAKEKRQEANDQENEQYEDRKAHEKQGTGNRKDDDSAEEPDESNDDDGDQDDDDDEGQDGEDEQDENEEDAEPGQKRRNAKQPKGSNKSQKQNSGNGLAKGDSKKANENSKNTDGTFGSKHMSSDEPAPRGSADRLPKKGQKAFWKAMPGIVDGTVQEVLTKGKTVDGKQVKASEDDPKIVLKSSAKSGKICVHKPDACFYEDE